jgi:hypothetical protein
MSLLIVSAFISIKLMYAIFFLGFLIIFIIASYNIVLYLIAKWIDTK